MNSRYYKIVTGVLLFSAILTACSGVAVQATPETATPDATGTPVPTTPRSTADSTRTASEWVGVVEAMGPDSWTISGQAVAITPQTEIKGSINAGDAVKVHSFLSDAGVLTALEIEPAPASSAADSGSPAPFGEFEYFGSVESIAPDRWMISGIAFTITGQTEIKDVIGAGNLVKVHAFFGSDHSRIAREIELASPADSSRVGRVEFTGTVEAILANGWLISGQTVLRTASTEMKGAIQVGDAVKVEGLLNPDGTISALEIGTPGADGSGDDSPDSGDDKGGDSGKSGSSGN